MAGRYKAYPEYQDSGIEWIDSMPTHWASVPIRWSAKLYAGGTPSKNVESYWEDGTVPWLNSGAVNQRIVTDPSTLITEAAFKNSSAKWIPKGALVVALAGQGKTKGMVASLAIRTTCNQSMAAVVPSELRSSRYLFWWLDSNYQNIRNMSGGDHRDGLNLELLGNIQCPKPPLPDQKQIARFLDHESAKIDRLIAKQQALIALLKEKRQAVISHAVTKGLNPNAKMKDSGVEWLGEVPEHWEVAKLKYFATMQGGYAFSSEQFCEEGVQLLRIGNVYLNQLALERQPVFLRRELLKAHPDFIVKQDDILMSLTGTLGKADYGYAVKVEEAGPFLLNQRVAKISPLEGEISHDYLLYSVRSNSYMKQLYSLPSGTKQANLSNSDVLNISIAVPPMISEQDDIGAYIVRKTTALDNLIMKSENAIELMQERRTALISAAVTGKIDVRDWEPACAGGTDE